MTSFEARTMSGLATDDKLEVDKLEAVAVQAPSPFDDLPDEVLLEILHSALVKVPDPSQAVTPQMISLNKRLYRLAREVWLSSAEFNGDWKLLARSELFPAVKSLDFLMSNEHPNAQIYEGVFVGQFTNLRSLTINTALPETEEFPESLTDSLRKLKHLHTLTFSCSSPWTLADKTFNIAGDLPTLRTLSIRDASPALGQLLTPSPALDHLGFTPGDDFEAYNFIPWSSLASLTVYHERYIPSAALFRGIGNSLTKALFPETIKRAPAKLPLRRFVHDHFKNGPVYDLVELEGLLEALRLTSVRQAVLNLDLALSGFSSLPSLPSLTSLKLEGRSRSIDTPDNLANLYRFLHTFPALQHLEILDTWLHRFMDAPNATEAPQDPASPEFIFAHPLVATLLAVLRQSTVLSLKWSEPRERGAYYQWTRTTTDEDFQADRYQRV
ncbi:hypothetical protein JCM8097_009007 [Rhodosporidiobolus ruineniae]